MKDITRRDCLATGAGLLPFTGLAALAGQAGQGQAGQNRTGQDQVGQGQGRQAGLDPQLAACLLIMGRKQIEVCRFALENIQHEDVKKFAQAEIDEHETVKKRLAELGYEAPQPGGSGDAGAAGNRQGQQQGQGQGQQGQGQQGRGQQGRGQILTVGKAQLSPEASQIVMIDHEVAEQCIATTKAEQSKLKGIDFDKRFVGSQLDAHYGLFDHGTVFRKYASQQMTPVLDEAKPIIERHIATCKQLMETLDARKNG